MQGRLNKYNTSLRTVVPYVGLAENGESPATITWSDSNQKLWEWKVLALPIINVYWKRNIFPQLRGLNRASNIRLAWQRIYFASSLFNFEVESENEYLDCYFTIIFSWSWSKSKWGYLSPYLLTQTYTALSDRLDNLSTILPPRLPYFPLLKPCHVFSLF